MSEAKHLYACANEDVRLALQAARRGHHDLAGLHRSLAAEARLQAAALLRRSPTATENRP